MTEHKQKSVLSSALAGGLAGISVDIVSFPIDTIKTRLQASYGSKETIRETIQKKSLYAGLSSNMIVSFPSAFCYFFGYEHTKRQLSKQFPGLSVTLVHMLGGMGAEILANTVRTPFEIVKQQMQMGLDHSLRSTFRSINAARGFRGFYAGFSSMIFREIPFSCIQMPIYEKMKSYTRRRRAALQLPQDFSYLENARNGIAAGSVGTLAVTELLS